MLESLQSQLANKEKLYRINNKLLFSFMAKLFGIGAEEAHTEKEAHHEHSHDTHHTHHHDSDIDVEIRNEKDHEADV